MTEHKPLSLRTKIALSLTAVVAFVGFGLWTHDSAPVTRVVVDTTTSTTIAPRPTTTTTTTTISPASAALVWKFAAGIHARDVALWNAHLPKRPAHPSTTTSAPAGSHGGGCAYANLIRSIWQRDAEWAIGIALRESHCTPGARSPDGALGIFQLLGHSNDFRAVGCSPDAWTDPACNVRAAWHLYERAGQGPWHL